MTAIEQAIKYVAENKTWSHDTERIAMKIMERQRCNISYANYKICDEIHDLMEEWSEEHDMPEGWWKNEMDETEIFINLKS